MKLPRHVVEAAAQRLEDSKSERSRVKSLIQERNLLEANTPEVIERRVGHIAEISAIAHNIERRPGGEELLSRASIKGLSSRGQTALERFIGEINDLLPGYFLPYGAAIRRTVGRITVISDGQVLGHGTGFLVSPRVLMTNNHVLSDMAVARESRIDFDFELDRQQKYMAAVSFRFDPDLFFITDPTQQDGSGLDYTFVAVEPLSEPTESGQRIPLATFGFNRLRPRLGKIIKGEAINIIQHPSGEPRQYCLQNNKLLELYGDDWLHYESDTAPGSSGSPLYNNQWEVIGLHHAGVPRKDGNGNWLKRDGAVADQDTDDAEIDWVANEGARTSAILAHAARQVELLGDSQQQVFKEILMASSKTSSPENPELSDLSSPASSHDSDVPGPDGDEGGNHGTGGRNIADGRDTFNHIANGGNRMNGENTQENGISITLPMTLTFHVGEPVTTTVVNGRVCAKTDDKDNPRFAGGNVLVGGNVVAGGNAAPKMPPASDPRIAEALREFERFDPSKYLDSEQYAADQAEYYADIDWDAPGAELYEALSDLVERTHSGKPRYAPSRELYPVIDRQPDGQLLSIYTGEAFRNPSEMIRRELSRQLEIERRIESMRRSEAGLDDRALMELELALEAQAAFNCEHVVPQSWFAKKEPMRGDLHHLFTCQVRCNSARSNIPYFDFSDFPADRLEVDAKCGKREGNKFEPRHGKGAVARATLYFLLRYPGEIDNIAGELQQNRLKTITDWAVAESDQVGTYERHRNQEIFLKQGNRNPLIDLFDIEPERYKDIIEGIAFERGLG